MPFSDISLMNAIVLEYNIFLAQDRALEYTPQTREFGSLKNPIDSTTKILDLDGTYAIGVVILVQVIADNLPLAEVGTKTSLYAVIQLQVYNSLRVAIRAIVFSIIERSISRKFQVANRKAHG